MSWPGRRRDLTRRDRLPWLPRRPGSRGYRVLVLGGARSGKSVTAERLLAGRDRVDYVATGAVPDPSDPEWAARVAIHQERRPPHWATLETRDLEGVLAAPELAAPELASRQLATPVLVDCLSTWLAGVMDECGLWSAAPGADQALAQRVDGLVDAWRATRRIVVAVSNEVGSGVVPGTASGVRYRDELGMLNTRIAAEGQQVWLCTAGIPRRLR
ncbi:MAG: bifunctional adenosylcobinamide kinase/adenosylcobinamide-phosphate guanylyltransferase [Streptosporangiaceae bacterium]